MKVVKSAGSLVSSHLAPLISALLEATQNAEGHSLNYLSVRLSNQHATQEKFDLARIVNAKSSNLFETIQHVMQTLDLNLTFTIEKRSNRPTKLILRSICVPSTNVHNAFIMLFS